MVSAELLADDFTLERAPGKLPDYAAERSSFHRAFAAELTEAIASFPTSA